MYKFLFKTSDKFFICDSENHLRYIVCLYIHLCSIIKKKIQFFDKCTIMYNNISLNKFFI